METQNELEINAVESLKAFLGEWQVSGINFLPQSGSRKIPMHGHDRYTWLEGQHFLCGQWEHLSDESNHIGISVMGFDRDENTLYTRNFDNLGFDRKYMITQNETTWTFTGAQERAKRIFRNDGNAYIENWEILIDDNWVPLCTMNGMRQA